MIPKATIDFETRSACSLRKCGSWRYSLDPTTEILCLAFRLPYWTEGRAAIWHPAFPHLDIDEGESADELAELFDWIVSGGLVEAHNAWFERGIWTNILVPRHQFPSIAHHQWRCSAAKAATHALPRALEDAVVALKLPVQKDLVGHRLMKKISQPRKPLKHEREAWLNQHGAGRCVACKGKGTYRKVPCSACHGRGQLAGDVSHVPAMPILWHENSQMFHDLWAYCYVDVLAEEGLSSAIPDLSNEETALYLLDQQINERGFQLDSDAVETALMLVHQETLLLNHQLAVITSGAVKKATQRTRMLEWFHANGVDLVDTQAVTIDTTLTTETLLPNVRKALEIVRELGRSSTAKYTTMQRWACEDGRVRGGLLYHGASTGRWSGVGVQPHNFVRGTVKLSQEDLWAAIKTDNRHAIQTLRDKNGDQVGSVMLALANGLRGTICAPSGCELFVADYASIEARVLLWLADDEDALQVFRQGRDIYCEMASTIYHRAITKVDKQERQLGKAAVLGCGYQMGASKFVATADMYGVTIDEPFAKRVVDAYRLKFWRVKQMWGDQQQAAIEAIESDDVVECGRVLWYYDAPFLYCTLPSGRRLAYPFPEVQLRPTSWGALKPAITYEGINSYTRQWTRQASYGGMLVENIVQAVARDIMADAMLRCEQSGVYRPVLSVHDELVAEANAGVGSVPEFEQVLTMCPTWATGCPIEAEGWKGQRYHK